MASGEAVVSILEVLPTVTVSATPDTRAGGSTPAENVLVSDFDAGSSEYLDFKAVLLGYGGGGLTFTLPWMASSATAGQTRWELGIRRLDDDAEDIDTSHAYQFNGVSDTAPSASGELSYPTITFADGPDMDDWANGELAILRLYRDHDHGDDNMAGDAELVTLTGKET